MGGVQIGQARILVCSSPQPVYCTWFFRSTAEAYKAVGRALEWDILGKPEDETAMAQYQGDSGTLAERRWEALTFHMPEKEESSFWLRLCLWSSGVAHPPHFEHPIVWGMQF